MRITRSILLKSLVKPFYRQHAGLFVFLFVMMLGVVGVLNGAKFTDYHFFLIQGIFQNPFLFLPVLLIWLLYAKKTERFISNTLRSPDYSFLQILALLNSRKLYLMLVWIQFLLFLPIVLYILLIFAAGIYLHIYAGCIIILLYFVSLVLICARLYLYIIQNPGKKIWGIKNMFVLNTRTVPWLCIILFLSSVVIFFGRYY